MNKQISHTHGRAARQRRSKLLGRGPGSGFGVFPAMIILLEVFHDVGECVHDGILKFVVSSISLCLPG